MQEIKSLTSLRGIAAMAVVLQHFSVTAQRLCDSTIPSLVPHGYMAVDFFFVLSGYIMCYTYLQAFQQQGWQAYKPFLQKRAIRLLPLQIFCGDGGAAAGLGQHALGGPQPVLRG